MADDDDDDDDDNDDDDVISEIVDIYSCILKNFVN